MDKLCILVHLLNLNNYDNSVKKSIVIKESKGNIKLERSMVNTNLVWYNYSGFQVILTTYDLNAIVDIDNTSLIIKVEYKNNVECSTRQ